MKLIWRYSAEYVICATSFYDTRMQAITLAEIKYFTITMIEFWIDLRNVYSLIIHTRWLNNPHILVT